jgi:hypothetical protein
MDESRERRGDSIAAGGSSSRLACLLTFWLLGRSWAAHRRHVQAWVMGHVLLTPCIAVLDLRSTFSSTFDLQWPPSAKEWCDEAKRVPWDDLWA